MTATISAINIPYKVSLLCNIFILLVRFLFFSIKRLEQSIANAKIIHHLQELVKLHLEKSYYLFDLFSFFYSTSFSNAPFLHTIRNP